MIILFQSAVLSVLFWFSLHHESFQDRGALVLHLTGIQSNDGKIVVHIFDHEEGYPMDTNKVLVKRTLYIENSIATMRVNGLPYGTYAIGAYHDENINGQLDTNFIGFPTEGIGASNDARGIFGPPSFADAQFILKSDEQVVEFSIYYY